MLGLVNVAWLQIEPRYRWRCRTHAAELEGEADHTVRHPVPLVISEACVADDSDIALKETQHAGLGHVNVRRTPAISNGILHDLLDKIPEEGELRPAPFATADAVLSELAVEVQDAQPCGACAW